MNIPGFVQCTDKCLLETLRELLQVVHLLILWSEHTSVIDDIIVHIYSAIIS